MSQINASDLNSLNTNVYKYGSTAKVTTKLPSSLQSATGNNVAAGNKITTVNIQNIKSAINILEQQFSKNCCQAQCVINSNISTCQVFGSTVTVNCYTAYKNCKTVCQTNCSQCSYYNSCDYSL